MTTSNSTNFNMTRDQIISEALQLIGRLGEGETATANAVTLCSSFLNKLVKHWEAKGLHCWTESEGTVFLTQGQNRYTLSSTGDRACDDATLVETTLSAAGSGISLSLTTTVGMTAADHIGIQLDDGTRQWTTIVSVDSTTSVTINTALTGAAASGNTVFSYTTILDRPLHIMDARVRNSSGVDRLVDLQGRVEFMRITNKISQGPVNVIYYSPQRDSGLLYVWQTPSTDADRIKISYLRAIQDFDASGDNPDLPTEWLHAITFNLARIIAPSYGVDLAKKDPKDVINIAERSLAELEAWDAEQSSVYIIPDRGY